MSVGLEPGCILRDPTHGRVYEAKLLISCLDFSTEHQQLTMLTTPVRGEPGRMVTDWSYRSYDSIAQEVMCRP